MKRLQLFCLLLLIGCYCTSCAQTKPVIKSITAYYYERLPGMIAVHPDGTPRDRERDTIFLTFAETNGESPQWKWAWKGKMLFAVNAKIVTNTPLVIGKTKNENKEITLQPSASNKLWQLELLPQTTYRAPKQATAKNKILLEGRFRGKTFYKTSTEPVEIASPQYQ